LLGVTVDRYFGWHATLLWISRKAGELSDKLLGCLADALLQEYSQFPVPDQDRVLIGVYPVYFQEFALATLEQELYERCRQVAKEDRLKKRWQPLSLAFVLCVHFIK